MPLKYDTPPETEPLDLDELKRHLRIGQGVSTFDSELSFLIKAMSGKNELNNPLQFAMRRQLIKATLIFTLKDFVEKLELPRPPLIGVSSVEYRDADGDWQTVSTDNYEVNTDSTTQPGFIKFNSDYSFPTLNDDEEYPVRVTYVAGYQSSDGSSSDHTHVPANIRHAAMNLIGDMWHNRGSFLFTNMEMVELRKTMGSLIAPHNAARRFG